MALVSSRFNDDWGLRRRDPLWESRLSRRWEDWPTEWPSPKDMIDRFWADTDRWWKDWPTDWPRMDAVMPRFSNHLDRIDRNWRADPFWRDLYPRWAEPIFKEGIDVKANIVNDRSRFAVDIDAYQFKPEELQVKTLDDTLLIEGRHEDVKDPDNFTKMYFIRKYQLPSDVDPQSIASAIDGNGRLTVEAPKRYQAIDNRERMIPIEGPSKRTQSRSSSYSPRDRDSGRGSEQGYYRNDSRQSNYSDRYAAEQQQQSSPRGYTPKLTTPAPVVNPANTNGYRRSDYSSRLTDTNGYRSDRRREEFRSESRNGETTRNIPVIRSSSAAPPPQDAWRSDSRNDYRVDSPASNGLLRRADDRDNNRSESRTESVRSVKILRKTFE
uniref:SHSP domain-containing protein n=1 Tax=Panagrellus redivivus TaxID=6233 RepID=A0A7E4VKC7_PANRE